MSETLREIILPSKTGTVDPTAVTPDFIGQLYVNTNTNIHFFAKSTTIGDYEEIIDITSLVSTQAHNQDSDTKLDDGQVNEVTSSDLRTHLDDLTKHRLINDVISTTTNLYSASQIDALIVASTSNLDIKDSVVTVADSNITLSGEQTLNGVVTSGSRVGVVGQTTSEQNGIYITAVGSWNRADDANENSEVTNGLSFFVSNSGSTKNGNQYILITADPIIVGTTPLTFIEVPRIVLGTSSGTATEGDDSRVPTQDENDALLGTNGTPSSINKYVTNSDIRLHNQNTDTILTTDGSIALLNAGTLKTNLLSDDAINIQIDEIRARDGDGLNLFDDGGNGIFIKDGGNIGIGTPTPPNALTVSGVPKLSQPPMRIVSTVPGIIFEETDSGSPDGFQIMINAEQFRIQRNALNTGAFVSNLLQIDVNGKIGIRSNPDTNAQLTITNPSQTDGDEYLRFATERAWIFKQLNSGSSASLELRSEVDTKNFIISSPAGKSLATFRVSDSLPDDHQLTVDGKFLAKDFNRNTVYFTTEADLPAPVGGVITLQENTTYIMYNDDPTASQKQIIFTDRIQIPDTGGVRITSVGLATAILVYTGTGTFITTNATFTGFLTIDNLFMSCPNGTIFDIDAVLPVGSEFFPRFFLSKFGVFDTDTLGTIKTVNVNLNIGAFFDCKQGLILDGVGEFLIGDWRFTNWKNDIGAIMLTSKNMLRFPKIQNCTFETLPNETAFNIEPNIGNETYIMSGNSYRGTGTLYHTGISGTIASIADASTSGSVTAVSGTPFGEVIMTDTTHGLVQGEVITTSGFSDSNYNGIFEVLEIIDSDNFRIHALFTATGTGSWDSAKITVSDVTHGLVVDDGVQFVTDDFTLDYNTGYRVLANTADTFVVNATFTSTDTGTWNADSLTQTDPRLRIRANAGIPDSEVFARMTMLTNATETVISAVSTPVKVAGTWTELESERFSFSNGRWTYTGFEPVKVIVNIQFRVDVVSGNSRTINMYIAKNATIDTNTQTALLIDSGTSQQGNVTGLLSLNTGDFVELFGENDTTDDNIIIDSAKFITRE